MGSDAGFPDLEGKVAIVTGAGRGVGRAVARAYARAGARTVLCARTTSAVEGVADQIRREGGTASALRADVGSDADVKGLVRETLGRFERVDILVNNAAVLGPRDLAWEADPEAWWEAIRVNLYGTFATCRLVAPHMRAARRGKIINVAARAGVNPTPMLSAYSASKAAVINYTQLLAEELKPYRVNVNAVTVLAAETQLWRTYEGMEPIGETAEEVGDTIPAAEENVPLFLFLASDSSNHVTGNLLHANSLSDADLRT